MYRLNLIVALLVLIAINECIPLGRHDAFDNPVDARHERGQVETQVPGPRVELPKLIDITIRRVPFEAPKHRHFTSTLSKFDAAIEFRVQTDRPLNLSTAITPVLFVGETMLTEGEQVDKTIYTFLAFEEDKLEPGTVISLAYPDTPARTRMASKFRYQPP